MQLLVDQSGQLAIDELNPGWDRKLDIPAQIAVRKQQSDLEDTFIDV
jgi:hypothetical protein